jgi:hypothetical protein
MVQVVKSEWHQVEKRYAYDIDESVLSEIYPDLSDDEIEIKMLELVSGTLDVEEVINDAWEEGVDIDWDWLDEDDWWTDRKGGYEVTYGIEE